MRAVNRVGLVGAIMGMLSSFSGCAGGESARPEEPHREVALARASGSTSGTLGLLGGLALAGNTAAGYAGGSGYGHGAEAQQARPAMNREEYAALDPNGFVAVADQALSTFSADIDTASYSNARRFLQSGRMPPASAVRVEEMINYFRYDDPAPSAGEPIAVHTEVAGCPWAPEHRLLRIGMRTPDIDSDGGPARNLVFLIDVSGSMVGELPLLQRGMGLLVEQLRPDDKVAIVVYAGSTGLVLDSTPGTHRAKILEAIQGLRAGGSTNGAQGIELAYRTATRSFIEGGVNRVILATDGDFNVGVSSQGELARLIERERQSGVFLSVLGFGQGNLADARLETLADRGNGNGNGNGNYAYKDAGELGAGHHVTVLYEIVPNASGAPTGASGVDPLRYQRSPSPSGQHDGEFATVKVRFKAPDEDTGRLLTFRIAPRVSSRPSRDFRFSAAVAGFGLWLRRDPSFPKTSMPAMRAMAANGDGSFTRERRELVALMESAMRLQAID